MILPARYYTFTVMLELEGGMRCSSGLEFDRTMNDLARYAVGAFADSLPGHLFDARGKVYAAYITREKPGTMPHFPPKMDMMP